ncbi:hypothetical protein O181_049024 [Austropuccinia psidii MF-1]|uniref:Multifunctional tryptophan biosynthesis protein n=1 Tax=Austropuccinia psidii MF-1 TaxID=1389203 RepID=A0A9Q3DU38_9BASI|nr:hypothetical protein [Austropuccinia psidii MF-1]
MASMATGIDSNRQQTRVLMIDNYDSFTWNLYQYLCLLGAHVTVVRSQASSLEELLLDHPDISHLVISPGPGHPSTDSGISIPVLHHYAGKIPILGICMGLQCIYSAFGGRVTTIGEIVHGKTSTVIHDQKSLFKDLPQAIQCTRYHSLAGLSGTLPSELEITCWTHPNSNSNSSNNQSLAFDQHSSIIMGVRHKLYTIEAVQYHPESILSEEGKSFLKNFLKLKGGKWSDNPEFFVSNDSINSQSASSSIPTILQKICKQRLLDIQLSKSIPGTSPRDLQRKLNANLVPTQVDFYQRLRQGKTFEVALMAEIKRASPSKGSFVTDLTPTLPQISRSYAAAGASVISVLTEPTWFKGTLLDMLEVRLALEHIPNRPAILRKDFILDPYQIDEARCHGADTVLLIVACLSKHQLINLFNHAKSLGMEPLVEVNNPEELHLALQIGARVIGVNNRNLHDFKVDMKTTSNLLTVFQQLKSESSLIKDEIIFCALSGISTRADVERYAHEGVAAVLVGESMMKAKNKVEFVQELFGTVQPLSSNKSFKPLVKICGIKTPEMAIQASQAGADFIGLIFVQKSRRYVTPDQANCIINAVRASRHTNLNSSTSRSKLITNDWFSLQTSRLLSTASDRKPLFVGVFQDASLDEIEMLIQQVPIDLIQLHGQEPIGLSKFLSLPVIKTFHVSADIDGSTNSNQLTQAFQTGYHAIPLLDSQVANQKGGTGKTFDWMKVKDIVIDQQDTSITKLNNGYYPLILAGGLNHDNVLKAIESLQPFIIDVSGGVEDANGEKDVEKINKFIKLVKF